MKGSEKMKNCLDHNLRGGKVIEITSILDDIENEYKACIKESIDVFTTYDEVSAETYSDELICKAKIEMLYNLGYIEKEEADAICKMVSRFRLDSLDKLNEEIEKGNEKDGSKKN